MSSSLKTALFAVAFVTMTSVSTGFAADQALQINPSLSLYSDQVRSVLNHCFGSGKKTNEALSLTQNLIQQVYPKDSVDQYNISHQDEKTNETSKNSIHPGYTIVYAGGERVLDVYRSATYGWTIRLKPRLSPSYFESFVSFTISGALPYLTYESAVNEELYDDWGRFVRNRVRYQGIQVVAPEKSLPQVQLINQTTRRPINIFIDTQAYAQCLADELQNVSKE